MSYDISKSNSSKRQTLEKGQNVSKSCSFWPQKTCIPPRSDVFPILRAHISVEKFQSQDLTWKELCGIIPNSVAESGVIRGKITQPYATITRTYSEIMVGC